MCSPAANRNWLALTFDAGDADDVDRGIPVNRAPASHTFFSQRLRLHYIDWGNEGAPVMLLVHGIHDHCRTWDDLAAHFADDYHVVAPDLRGHGDSEWVRGSGYHYLDYIYDLHQLIVQADLGPVVLLGHSMGGAIAALFAGVYPELVSRLVLIEAIGLWEAQMPPQPIPERVREWVNSTRSLAARQARRYRDLSEAYHRMQQANPQLSDRQALHLTVHGSNQNEDGTYSWKYDNYTHNFAPGNISTEETLALWQSVACPVLVINASDGLEHRIGHDDTLRYFADSRLVVLRGAGHWTYHDQPAAVLQQLDEFLRE
jgi:pimeloyl-ACP methyl ester carboxylesterase